MKTLIGIRLRDGENAASFREWLLNTYARSLAQDGNVERLVINLVQTPPDFIPVPPPNPHAFKPYDALVALWSKGNPPDFTELRQRVAVADIFHVDEIVEKNEFPERAGVVTQGIKNLPALIYRSDLTAAEGLKKWDAHAKLGLQTHIGMKRYVRNIVTSRSDGAPPIGGIAEVSFPTQEDLRTGLFPTPQDRAAFIADVAGFVQATVSHYSMEHVVKW